MSHYRSEDQLEYVCKAGNQAEETYAAGGGYGKSCLSLDPGLAVHHCKGDKQTEKNLGQSAVGDGEGLGVQVVIDIEIEGIELYAKTSEQSLGHDDYD